MNRKTIISLTLGAVLSLSFATWTQVATAQTVGVTTTPASSDLTDGEIRKVDKVSGKLTIKHGPIKSLDMPSMTMVYQVRDKSLLDKAQAGDKVRFRAEKEGEKFLVIEIRPTR